VSYVGVLFAASGPAAAYAERIAIVLGVITLVTGLTAFFSCRTFVGLLARVNVRPTKSPVFQAFYQRHLYYWWAFGVAVVSHFLMAVLHTGLPQRGDPDAGVHWVILGIGFAGAVASAALFSSCRVYPRLVGRALKGFNTAGKAYRSLFKYHSYYWWVFAALVGVHFAVGFIHAGIWPGG